MIKREAFFIDNSDILRCVKEYYNSDPLDLEEVILDLFVKVEKMRSALYTQGINTEPHNLSDRIVFNPVLDQGLPRGDRPSLNSCIDDLKRELFSLREDNMTLRAELTLLRKCMSIDNQKASSYLLSSDHLEREKIKNFLIENGGVDETGT